MSDELLTVADVVGLVVFGVGEDHQYAIGGEVVHLAPEARADEEALGGGVEDDALFATTIEQAQAHGAGHADAELAELLVGVEAAADTRLGAVDPVDATDGERERPAQFGDGKPATRVTALRDVDKLDERRAHRPWVMMVLRYDP
jgi:hypothetical protein